MCTRDVLISTELRLVTVGRFARTNTPYAVFQELGHGGKTATHVLVVGDETWDGGLVSIDPLASTAVFEQNVEYPGGLRKRRHVCFSLGGMEAEPNPPLQPAGCDGG